MKSSFLLHVDSLCILDELNDEQKGQLFYAIYMFQLGEEIELSPIIKIAFSQFKNQFIRDNKAYEETVEKRRMAGSKGGKQRVANQANASNAKQKQANQADKDNKNKKDNEKDSDNKSKSLTLSSSSTRVADYLLMKILSVNPDFKKPSLNTWAKDIDKAIRLDNRTENQLIGAIDWIYTAEGSFWQSNILSGKKLREKFDTMQAQHRTRHSRQKNSVDDIYATGMTASEIIDEMIKKEEVSA